LITETEALEKSLCGAMRTGAVLMRRIRVIDCILVAKKKGGEEGAEKTHVNIFI